MKFWTVLGRFAVVVGWGLIVFMGAATVHATYMQSIAG